jgi:hypothetical protein
VQPQLARIDALAHLLEEPLAERVELMAQRGELTLGCR